MVHRPAVDRHRPFAAHERQRRPRRRLTRLACAACLAACSASPDDLGDGIVILPPGLREVSAIAALDERTLVCLQDEAGALFFVDLEGKRPTRVAAFGEPADYEGLAVVGDQYWVLRSDGLLLRLRQSGATLEVSSRHPLPKGHKDWEGLCYDADRGQLLVMPKDRSEDRVDRDDRFVFAVDPATGIVHEAPALVVSLPVLLEQALVRGIDLPTRVTGKGRTRVDLTLACSELLVLPGRDEVLLLSAADRALVRVDREGRLLGFQRLPERDLPQPEGMALLPDGRLLVASEGRGGPGFVRVVRSE